MYEFKIIQHFLNFINFKINEFWQFFFTNSPSIVLSTCIVLSFILSISEDLINEIIEETVEEINADIMEGTCIFISEKLELVDD